MRPEEYTTHQYFEEHHRKGMAYPYPQHGPPFLIEEWQVVPLLSQPAYGIRWEQLRISGNIAGRLHRMARES